MRRDDDRQIRLNGPELLDDFGAGATGQREVDQGDILGMVTQIIEGGIGLGEGMRVEASGLFQGLPDGDREDQLSMENEYTYSHEVIL